MSQAMNFMKSPEEEIDIQKILLILWGNRIWIFIGTFFVTLLGVLYVSIVTPRYYSYATLAVKAHGLSSGGAGFSQLSSMVASPFGGGNSNVKKMEILLKSEEVALAVIEANDLLPILFPKLWDNETGRWKEPQPSLRQAAKKLRQNILKVTADERNGILRVGAELADSIQALKVVQGYIVEINRHVRENVRAEADSNRHYLEGQLAGTTDPIMVEKIHNIIAAEIGRAMLISSSPFEVLEGPNVPLERVYPQKRKIVLLFFAAGIFLSALLIFLIRSVEGAGYMQRIKKRAPIH